MAYKRLGELLIAAGAITEEDLQRGLQLQRGTKERLGTILIEHGILSEQRLIEALQVQLGIDFVDLSRVTIPTELGQLITKAMAVQYNIVPVRLERNELYLAMSDPMNIFAIEDVRKAVRKKVVPMVATRSGIEHAIEILYSNEGAAKAIAAMKRRVNSAAEAAPPVQDPFAANRLGDDAAGSGPAVQLVNSMIELAVTERASDIHLEPWEREMKVRMRIDGLMRSILPVPRDIQSSVISRIKIMSGLDISERRIPQDGRFNVRVKNKDIDLRVSTLPTVYGENIVIRLLDKSGGRLTEEAIGLTGSDFDKYLQMLRHRSGMVLLVGPTGSGKTTTMYAIINRLNTPEICMTTLEDPVEYNVEGVHQVQVNEKTGMTFAAGLRSILRQDPDIIAVGEIRDGETAEIAMRSAITGHRVFSTIHTNDALGTIDRLRDIGVEPYVIASALKGVISQRLVRRICPNCREAYTPTEEEVSAIGLPYRRGIRFYRGTGCPDCFSTGYRGRIGVFEMLVVNRELRRHIYAQADHDTLETVLRNQQGGFTSLQENAQRLVLEGVTTSAEVMRVVNEED
jgi:type IV pilus assembly protein PilB